MSRRTLVSNVLSLSSVQIANYLLPLVTMPYVVRVIGPDNFGLVNYAQSIVGYFIVITSFGINLSGARDVAVVRDDATALNHVFSKLLFTRLLLFVISSGLFFLIVFMSLKLSANKAIFIAYFPSILSEILFPVWFFQGLEKMAYISIFNFVAKLIATLLVFLLIKNASDYILLPVINVSSTLLIGIVALSVIRSSFKIDFFVPKFKVITQTLKENVSIFLSDVYVNVYTASYPVILSMFASYADVGFFSGAQKIVFAWVGLQNMVITATYPHLSRLMHENRDSGIMFLQKMSGLCFMISIPATTFALIFAPQIVLILLGQGFVKSILILKLLSLLIILITVNGHLTFQGMLTLNNKQNFNIARLAGGIIAAITVFPLTYLYKDIGVACTYVLSEIAVFSASCYLLNKEKIQFITDIQIKQIALIILISLILALVLFISIKNIIFIMVIYSVMIVISIFKMMQKDYDLYRSSNV